LFFSKLALVHKMKVELAENSGFCFGVRRAMETVRKESTKKKKVYTIGPLIHNKLAVRRLELRGIKALNSAQAKKGTVIIRTHGLPGKQVEELRKRGVRIIDATCPFVKKVQMIAKQFHNKGYHIVVVGDKNHPEVLGIVDSMESVTVVSGLKEAKALGLYERLVVVAQTTQSTGVFRSVVSELRRHAKELVVHNTICSATMERQKSATDLAGRVELMIVVGDMQSGNTKRLYELCRPIVKTVLIEQASEIRREWLVHQRIGVTAGASTPEWVVNAVLNRLSKKRAMFEKKLSDMRDKIDREIKRIFIREVEGKKDAFLKGAYKDAFEYVVGGGKRLRPILLISAYRAVGGRQDITIPALSVEMLHNSTLIHDDVMDEDTLRRGRMTIFKTVQQKYLNLNKETAYNGPLFSKKSARFSAAQAMCIGNILVSLGASCLGMADRKRQGEAMRIFFESYKTINEGQMRDLLSESRKSTEGDYLKTALMKTGHLFRASIEIGAVLGNASMKQRMMLSRFALSAAIAFQLQDDLLDIDEKSKGRVKGSDLLRGKKTLLVIKALELGMEKEKKAIRRALGNESASKREVEQAIEAIHTSGAVRYINSLVKSHFEESKSYLNAAKLNKTGFDFFNNFADYTLHRKS